MAQRKFIREGVEAGFRNDGRGNFDSRDFRVERGVIPSAFGSSRITYGEDKSQIICAVKAEISGEAELTFALESSHSAVNAEQQERMKQRMLEVV